MLLRVTGFLKFTFIGNGYQVWLCQKFLEAELNPVLNREFVRGSLFYRKLETINLSHHPIEGQKSAKGGPRADRYQWSDKGSPL